MSTAINMVNEKYAGKLFDYEFVKILIATVVGTILGSNTGPLAAFTGFSQGIITVVAAIAAFPIAIAIHLLYRTMERRRKRIQQERELSKLQTYQDPTTVPMPKAGEEILITGYIGFNGVIVQAHLYDSGEIVVDGFLCPKCRSELYHPESPLPSEVDEQTVTDTDLLNHSNKAAIKEAKEEGRRLWVLECPSASCEYRRYDYYTDIPDEEYQIKSIFKKHFDHIKTSPEYAVKEERPVQVWERYAYQSEDEEVFSTANQLSIAERIKARFPV